MLQLREETEEAVPLLCLEEENGAVAEVKVDEVLRLWRANRQYLSF
jgi:hypothetical protein